MTIPQTIIDRINYHWEAFKKHNEDETTNKTQLPDRETKHR